jgi:hypothetical protein
MYQTVGNYFFTAVFGVEFLFKVRRRGPATHAGNTRGPNFPSVKQTLTLLPPSPSLSLSPGVSPPVWHPLRGSCWRGARSVTSGTRGTFWTCWCWCRASSPYSYRPTSLR